MSYTPINWQNGDTITAEKMNKMDNGWSVGITQLFSESVTTASGQYGYEGVLTYSETIDANLVIVNYDGVEYECNKIMDGIYGGFGNDGPDFTEYPFMLYSYNGTNTLYTETAGTHTISLAADTIQISDNFIRAVTACAGGFLMQCVPEVTTYDEMDAARQSGGLLYFYVDDTCHFISSFVNDTSPTAVTAVPEGAVNVETFGFGEDGDGNLIFNVFRY